MNNQTANSHTLHVHQDPGDTRKKHDTQHLEIPTGTARAKFQSTQPPIYTSSPADKHQAAHPLHNAGGSRAGNFLGPFVRPRYGYMRARYACSLDFTRRARARCTSAGFTAGAAVVFLCRLIYGGRKKIFSPDPLMMDRGSPHASRAAFMGRDTLSFFAAAAGGGGVM